MKTPENNVDVSAQLWWISIMLQHLTGKILNIASLEFLFLFSSKIQHEHEKCRLVQKRKPTPNHQ